MLTIKTNKIRKIKKNKKGEGRKVGDNEGPSKTCFKESDDEQSQGDDHEEGNDKDFDPKKPEEMSNGEVE